MLEKKSLLISFLQQDLTEQVFRSSLSTIVRLSKSAFVETFHHQLSGKFMKSYFNLKIVNKKFSNQFSDEQFQQAAKRMFNSHHGAL
jgi:hypothetical protein